MALHLQVHGYILNRKKAQHYKSNHTRKNHKRDFGRGLWVTTVCVPEPRVSCRPQHHAARAAQAAASPQSPEQGPSFLSQRGGECVRGWASVRKKKEKGLKHRKKVMQRDTERDLYTGSFKLCRAARGTKLTVWAASGNAGLCVYTTANMRPVTAPKIKGRYLQCVLQCLCMHPCPPSCISNTNSLCSSYKTTCKRLSRIRQPHWRVIRGICDTGFTCNAPV